MRERRSPKKIKIRDREIQCWELRQQGLPMWKIAEEMGMSPSGVSSMLKRLDERALRNLQTSIFEAKSRQTAALEFLYSEAVAGWERSKEAQVVRTTVTRPKRLASHEDEGGPIATEPSEFTVRTMNQAGDPRFLDQAMKALAAVRQVWGLDAPQKVAQVDENLMRDARELTDAQLAAIVAAGEVKPGSGGRRALKEAEGTDLAS